MNLKIKIILYIIMLHEVKNSNNEDCVDDLVRLNDKRGVAGPKMATEVIISNRCKIPVSFLAL